MSAQKKKSKKRSGAQSPKPPELAFYLESNMGRHMVAASLRGAGCVVHLHSDHLPQDASDQQWLQLVGRNGWIAVTKDNRIRYRHHEKRAAIEHKARVLVLRAQGMTGEEMGRLLADNAKRIERFMIANRPPLIATISRSGKLQLIPLR